MTSVAPGITRAPGGRILEGVEEADEDVDVIVFELRTDVVAGRLVNAITGLVLLEKAELLLDRTGFVEELKTVLETLDEELRIVLELKIEEELKDVVVAGTDEEVLKIVLDGKTSADELKIDEELKMVVVAGIEEVLKTVLVES